MKIDLANLSFKDAHELLAGAIAPRPIAFVSTIGENGVFNLAPYSFFTPMCVKPALIGFGTGWKRDGQKKDTLKNIEFAKEFVVCVVDETLAEPMNKTSYPFPSDVDEFKEAALTPVKADLVKAPLVAESPINLECRLVQILEFGEAPQKVSFIIGEILRANIRDDLYVNGEIESSKLKTIGRLGGELYCRTTDIFEMKRPYIFGEA